MAEKVNKKVVHVESKGTPPPGGPKWQASPQSKGKATRYRVIALLMWLIAIGGEAFAIFYVLKQDKVNMVLLIGAIVVIGALAIIGNILWKKANQFDPASRAQSMRFFFQNQLGAIITVVAFLPLIVMIFLNKNMDKKQKGIAGTIAIVIALIATYFGMSFDSPSQEKTAAETARIVALVGEDEVWWTKSGEVYHLCQEASDMQRESEDNQAFSGTVAAAHENGKSRLTLKVEAEIEQCGLDPADDPGIDGGLLPEASPTA